MVRLGDVAPETFSGWATNPANPAAQLGQSVGGYAQQGVGQIAGTSMGLVGGAGNVVGGTMGTAGNFVGQSVGSAGNFVGGTMGSAGQVVGGTMGTAGNFVGGTMGTAGQMVGGTTGFMGNTVSATPFVGSTLQGGVAAGQALPSMASPSFAGAQPAMFSGQEFGQSVINPASMAQPSFGMPAVSATPSFATAPAVGGFAPAAPFAGVPTQAAMPPAQFVLPEAQSEPVKEKKSDDDSDSSDDKKELHSFTPTPVAQPTPLAQAAATPMLGSTVMQAPVMQLPAAGSSFDGLSGYSVGAPAATLSAPMSVAPAATYGTSYGVQSTPAFAQYQTVTPQTYSSFTPQTYAAPAVPADYSSAYSYTNLGGYSPMYGNVAGYNTFAPGTYQTVGGADNALVPFTGAAGQPASPKKKGLLSKIFGSRA